MHMYMLTYVFFFPKWKAMERHWSASCPEFLNVRKVFSNTIQYQHLLNTHTYVYSVSPVLSENCLEIRNVHISFRRMAPLLQKACAKTSRYDYQPLVTSQRVLTPLPSRHRQPGVSSQPPEVIPDVHKFPKTFSFLFFFLFSFLQWVGEQHEQKKKSQHWFHFG